MTDPDAGANSGGDASMVKMTLTAIVIMTLAITFLIGAIFGRLMSDGGGRPPEGAIEFASAPALAISLPEGAQALDIHADAERVVIVYESEDGARGVATAPLSGYDAPTVLELASNAALSQD